MSLLRMAMVLLVAQPAAAFAPAAAFGRRALFRPPSSSAAASQASPVLRATVDPSDVMVVMNGLPGAMGKEVAAACVRRGMKLAPVALTGRDFAGTTVDVMGTTVTLADGTDAHAADAAAAAAELARVAAGCAKLVCVDYTHPTAVEGNAAWYVKHGFAFVMGTTGGDRRGLTEAALAGGGCKAVVAPNMAKQIVALQATLEGMAATFPGAFEGYALSVEESHQSTKADTSGTAKALVRALNTLTAGGEGDDELEARIRRIRDRDGQLAFHVPEDALKGHAFHTYTLRSPDGSVSFALEHNVCGRDIYAEGTADAVLFVAGRGEAEPKCLYNMVDVLQAGAMN